MVIVILSFNLISTHAPAGGATGSLDKWDFRSRNFYSRPCGRGDGSLPGALPTGGTFLLTPLREGRPQKPSAYIRLGIFLLTPLREGRQIYGISVVTAKKYFYSRPCGRGDDEAVSPAAQEILISTHAPAGGATSACTISLVIRYNFYSRPCGRGDTGDVGFDIWDEQFLLTPLREGRRIPAENRRQGQGFLLTPLREGRRAMLCTDSTIIGNFYSRPCGRGDTAYGKNAKKHDKFLLTPLREGRQCTPQSFLGAMIFLLTPLREGRRGHDGKQRRDCKISTHAPAGGATAPCRTRESVKLISTHAPAGGATAPVAGVKSLRINFYSRPCGRGDSRRRR